MNLKKIEKIKGFMPANEGKALLRWAEKFSNFGPILEIGTYCCLLYTSDAADDC